MLKTAFINFFDENLTTLKKEIEAYQNEQHLWITEKNIHNCAGNLCLHLIGNLNHFIGNVLGNTGYQRERDKEFSVKNISRKELTLEINKIKQIVSETLYQLNEEKLTSVYPLEFKGKQITIDQLLLELSTHFTYHLGQINYHRRLLEKTA